MVIAQCSKLNSPANVSVRNKMWKVSTTALLATLVFGCLHGVFAYWSFTHQGRSSEFTSIVTASVSVGLLLSGFTMVGFVTKALYKNSSCGFRLLCRGALGFVCGCWFAAFRAWGALLAAIKFQPESVLAADFFIVRTIVFFASIGAVVVVIVGAAIDSQRVLSKNGTGVTPPQATK
jgi:uncharacterized membrane protein YsdA (DUF1294 family)